MGTQDEPVLSLLTGNPHPDLARALRACVEKILARWEAIVCEVLPKADQLTFTQLRDDIPKILVEIASAMEAPGQRHIDRLLSMTAEHGTLRHQQRYNLNELLIEYDLLRPVLIEELVTELGRRTSVEETVALNAGIDLCTRRAVITFVENQSKELQAATEAQSKYLSFLSHDLRGGLNGVFLMIEVLKREIATEPRFQETIGDLDSMRRTLLETVSTMDRFLHAERFRKGKIVIQPFTLSLKSLLTELSAHFAYEAREKRSTLEISVPAELKVVTDRAMMTLIVQNLLSNSLKYAPGSPIRIGATTSPDGQTTITISDQGPGISKEKLAELFTPFARGETYGQPGVGLGLSIARQAADLLGAQLWAESEVGNGATFFIKLPPTPPAPAANA